MGTYIEMDETKVSKELWEEFRQRGIKANHAESLVWHIGFIKTLLELGVDPQYMLDDLAVRYKTHGELGQALSDGIEFAEKSFRGDDYKYIDRVLKMPYNHGTD